jgi:hypothetical protein
MNAAEWLPIAELWKNIMKRKQLKMEHLGVAVNVKASLADIIKVTSVLHVKKAEAQKAKIIYWDE